MEEKDALQMGETGMYPHDLCKKIQKNAHRLVKYNKLKEYIFGLHLLGSIKEKIWATFDENKIEISFKGVCLLLKKFPVLGFRYLFQIFGFKKTMKYIFETGLYYKIFKK